jgi:DnaJ-class molecular chaperone
MNLGKNYYSALGVANTATEKEIKKKYYKLSFTHHPDRGGDALTFAELTEAYDVLCSKDRGDYDLKSKFGNNYNEYFELFNINSELEYDDVKSKKEKFRDSEVLNIQIKVGDDFDGSVEYERYVKCKSCAGSGKDLSSKIVIKDVDGNILRTFDADDGCDFCEGSGKDYRGESCSFCSGHGKVGMTPCNMCKGDKRILGKQKLSGIKLEGDETKVDSMGHHSKSEPGKSGYLLIVKNKSDID